MRADLKKYGLRSTLRPAKNRAIASTVVVRNEQGEHGYCYINFDPPFVEAVGREMPRGVGPEDPAHLSVLYYGRTATWLVTCSYLGEEKQVLLWRSATKPAWLNFHKVSKHDRATEGDSDCQRPRSGKVRPSAAERAGKPGRTEEEDG